MTTPPAPDALADRLRRILRLHNEGWAMGSTEMQTIADAVAALTRDQESTGTVMNIDALVDRFLSWPLPKDFAPDCGISFDGRKDDEWNKNKTWPIGTNLFTADQAKTMFEHCLAGSAPPEGEVAQPVAWHLHIDGIGDSAWLSKSAARMEIEEYRDPSYVLTPLYARPHQPRWEVAALREALRRHCISKDSDYPQTYTVCTECNSGWPREEQEDHASYCLAQLEPTEGK